MVAKGSRRRATLQNGLDREILQVVRKYQDDQVDAGRVPTISAVYSWIQNSNSTLKRKPKNLLEASIDRVIEVLQEDYESEELGPLEVDFVEEPKEQIPDRSNLMNKALRGSLVPLTEPKAGNDSSSAVEIPKKRDRDVPRQTNGEPLKKRRKPVEKQEEDRSPPGHIRLEDVGGVDDIKQQLADHLVMPLLCAEEYVRRKLPIPRGILLHGPPGCGKTLISRAFASKLDVPFIEILGPSIVSGMSGESEQKIREHFEEARRLAPCLLFIDEIDVIAPKRDSAQSQMEKRIVAQLLISMDSLAMESNDGKPVIVLAATNRPDSIDPALRRGGRFDTEINMGVPNETMRAQILRTQTRDTNVSSDVDFTILAKMTSGFVGADLRDLVGKAGTWSMDQYKKALERQAEHLETDMEIDADGQQQHLLPVTASERDRSISRLIKRLRDKNMERPEGFESTSITMEAFLTVLPGIQPSSKREGFATIPDTTWEDIGAMQKAKQELMMAIVRPIKDPALFARYGITSPSGVLLWGPPGCGKTLIAKAVANESRANFISVKGPELLNKFLGESERAVRQVFTRARSSVPCVLFFDEVDALLPSRSGSTDTGGSEASARVVNTMLTELDGLSSREGIYLIAATNRPDIIDTAILRPGRLGTMLYVGLPEPEERIEILRTLINITKVIDPSLAQVAQRDECHNFSGADLSNLLRKAQQHALERAAESVTEEDFLAGAKQVKPSVGDLKRYERMKERFRAMV